MLGDTLEKIAFEKAGIIKQNVPVIIGEILPETKKIFEQVAKEQNAPLVIANRQPIAWRWEKPARRSGGVWGWFHPPIVIMLRL